MKIVSLRIKNIASLKGEHFIDFENILKHSQVFAITGETGAGKSTLLNSISLALYGQNYKKANKHKDFVTLGESEGEIELTYQVRNIHYKALWYLRLKKNDGSYLKTPQQERRFSKMLNGKWQTIQESPAQILNLDFDQFSKTILLNQGEFAKFLSSGFKDRKDILSKLYDGEKLERLSLHVKRKINSVKSEIETFMAQIQGINENTNFDLDEAKKLVKADKQQKDKLSQLQLKALDSHKLLLECKKLKEQYDKNQEHKEKLKENLKKLTSEHNERKRVIKEKEDFLKKEKKEFEKKSPLLIECVGQQKLLIEKKNALEQENRKFIDIISSKEKERAHIEELNKNIQKIEDQLEKLAFKDENYIIPIDDLTRAQVSMEQFFEIEAQEELLTKEINIYQQDIVDIEKKANELKEKKEQQKQDQDQQGLEALKENLHLLQQKRDNYTHALTSVEDYYGRKQVLDKDLTNNKELLNKNDQEIQNLEKELPELTERSREQELALKSFGLQEYINEVAQKSLETGECLVCHNTDLCDVKGKDLDLEEKNQLQQRWQSSQNQIKNIQIKLQGLRSSQAHFRGTQQQLTEQKKQLSHKLLAQFQFLSYEDFQQDQKKTLEKLQNIIKECNGLITQNEQKFEAAQKKEIQIKEMDRQIEQLRKDYTHKSELLAIAREKLQAGKNILDGLKTQLETLLQAKVSKENLRAHITSLKDFHSLSHRLEDQQKAKLKSQEYFNKLCTNEILNKEEKESLLKQIKDYEAFIQKNSQGKPQEELNQLKKQLEQHTNEFTKQQRLFNEIQIAIAEETSKEKNYSEQCDQTENLFKITVHDLNQVATSFEEENFQLKDQMIKDKFKDFFLKLTSKIQISLITPHVLSETLNYNDQLIQQIKEIIGKLTQTIIKNETLITQKLSAQDKIDKINKDIEKLNEHKNQLEDLYDLVGKDEFRNFVLSLIEKNLIIQTNHELKNLCDDRYLIKHFSKNVNSMPDFYVVDKYKAGLTRKVSTLSGGETFMVSLAMALALAELSRGTSEVESFFIDEGFGTLDDDALEDVLDMIKNMEQRGKSIGLISHIKKLTDRINVNIDLKKSDLGNSTISIHYN